MKKMIKEYTDFIRKPFLKKDYGWRQRRICKDRIKDGLVCLDFVAVCDERMLWWEDSNHRPLNH